MEDVGDETVEGSSEFGRREGRDEETRGGMESVMKPRSMARSMDEGWSWTASVSLQASLQYRLRDGKGSEQSVEVVSDKDGKVTPER